VVRIRMPPLRERSDDIPAIVDFCLQNLVKAKKARVGKVSPEAMALLTRYRWPGNVRELENTLYRSAVIAQGDAILMKDLPPEIRGDPVEPAATGLEPILDLVYAELSRGTEPILPLLEREMIARVLRDIPDVSVAAEKLGLSKTFLSKKPKA